MNESKTPRETQPVQQCVEASGPWPFITHRVHRSADGTQRVWSSRHHRKGLVLREDARPMRVAETLLRCLWMPRKLNWWIGTIFAVGSFLFALASVLSLAPDLGTVCDCLAWHAQRRGCSHFSVLYVVWCNRFFGWILADAARNGFHRTAISQQADKTKKGMGSRITTKSRRENVVKGRWNRVGITDLPVVAYLGTNSQVLAHVPIEPQREVVVTALSV